MMKKVLLCVCALVTTLSLAACSGAPAASSASTPASDSQVASVSEAVPESVSEPASEASDADYTAYSINFDVPEGFEQVDASGTGASVIYQAEDGSNINVVIMENDGSLASDVSMEDLVGPIEEAFSQQYGEDVHLLDVAFTTGNIGPCPYYRLDYSVTVAGVDLYQTGIGISADRGYTISYTDTNYGRWRDVFEESISSITPVEK